MKKSIAFLLVGFALAPSPAQATYLTSDVEAECRAVSEPGWSSCTCRGRYFVERFGAEDGAIALHLAARSYAPQNSAGIADLYQRFSAAKLDKVAVRMLETRGEVVFYCPFSNLEE